jgi:hypothetical protein
MRTMAPPMTPVCFFGQGPYRIIASRRCELDRFDPRTNHETNHEDETRGSRADSSVLGDHLRGSEDVSGIPDSLHGEMNECH